MVECEQLQRVSAFIDGELPPAEQAMFARHLEMCLDCRQVLENLRADARQMAQQRPTGEMPVNFLRRMHAAVEREWETLRPQRDWLDDIVRPFVWRLVGLAACIVIGGSVWLRKSGAFVARPPQPRQIVSIEPSPVSMTSDGSGTEVASTDITSPDWGMDDLSQGGAR